jgi:hypothetical protein
VEFHQPLAEAKAMHLVATIEYEGAKRTDDAWVRSGRAVFGTPKIDGDLSDPVWAQASALKDFVRHDSAKLGKHPVTVRMAFDEENVYVSVDADAGGSDKLPKKEVARDGDWWGVNALEILFGKTHVDTVKMKFGVACTGGLFDKFTGAAKLDGAPFSGAVKKTERGWAGEVAIPLSNLGCGAPGAGDLWRMNFTNYVFAKKQQGVSEEYTQYVHQGKADFNLGKFAHIFMTGNPKPSVGKVSRPEALPEVLIPMDAKIAVDGKLDEDAWKKAEPLELGYISGIATPPEDKTTARLAADAENLYFTSETLPPRDEEGGGDDEEGGGGGDEPTSPSPTEKTATA